MSLAVASIYNFDVSLSLFLSLSFSLSLNWEFTNLVNLLNIKIRKLKLSNDVRQDAVV
jgi:hypothetical protein